MRTLSLTIRYSFHWSFLSQSVVSPVKWRFSHSSAHKRLLAFYHFFLREDTLSRVHRNLFIWHNVRMLTNTTWSLAEHGIPWKIRMRERSSIFGSYSFRKKGWQRPTFRTFLGAPQRLVILADPLEKYSYENADMNVWLLPEYIPWSNKAYIYNMNWVKKNGLFTHCWM